MKYEDKLFDHDYDGIQEFDNILPPWWLNLFYITIIYDIIIGRNKHDKIKFGDEVKFVCVDGPEFNGHLVDFDNMISRLNSYKNMNICVNKFSEPRSFMFQRLNKTVSSPELDQAFDSCQHWR